MPDPNVSRTFPPVFYTYLRCLCEQKELTDVQRCSRMFHYIISFDKLSFENHRTAYFFIKENFDDEVIRQFQCSPKEDDDPMLTTSSVNRYVSFEAKVEVCHFHKGLFHCVVSAEYDGKLWQETQTGHRVHDVVQEAMKALTQRVEEKTKMYLDSKE